MAFKAKVTKLVGSAAGSLGLLAAVLAAASAAVAPQFDQGVPVRPYIEEARAEAKGRAGPLGEAKLAAAPEQGALWISVGSEDLSKAVLPLGIPVVSSARAAVFKVSEDSIVQIADMMHERFGKCGGFFAYDNRAEAEADLAAPPAAAGGPYTLDQEAWVKPLVSKVKEAQLRATIETMAAYNNRYYQSDTGVAAAQWVGSRWQQLAQNIPGASLRMFPHAGWKQPSVILTIAGSQTPEEVVVLGGHLDSIAGMWGGSGARAPGADDNASGIAVLTEAIRVLGEGGFRPRRTVQFMGYAAEEVGLRGSAEIAKSYKGGTKVAGVIQFDMTNYKGSGDTVYLLSDNVEPGLTAFLGKLVDAYVGVGWANTACGYGCSDHASWTKNGFAASAAFESSFDAMNRNIHSDKDTLGNAGGNAEHSAHFAKLAVAFAVEMGKAAAAPPASLAATASKSASGR
ncbi:MAG: M20/M25/M40 family metallo-hydrolase [Elusimicrobia bacterium]|nr:M20/M25/M40 family metallo-hydrolase [Elusimicrobiota bacterium]